MEMGRKFDPSIRVKGKSLKSGTVYVPRVRLELETRGYVVGGNF